MTQPTLMAQLAELQEENARLREDAERYRFLRGCNLSKASKISLGALLQGDAHLDAAIDAARKEQK